MKSDLEKLLEAIGSLETERVEWEEELEQAKKVAEQQVEVGLWRISSRVPRCSSRAHQRQVP
jgi:hypothetical protein